MCPSLIGVQSLKNYDSELSIFVQIIRASSREFRYSQLFGGWRVACYGHGIPRKRDRN
ncbi:MAG TPA: hypothetical protein VFD87_10975 [Phototrophicaceae bacterium]|nr:hypothetical protein [Phototrophicaceae bacterium]